MADAAVSGGGEGDLDATVELLRLCVEKGVEVRAERGGFLLGVGEDDARWVARVGWSGSVAWCVECGF